jgi:MFS family permease
MTAAAARRSPSSRAQLALKSESIITPAKMRTSATTNPTRILCQRSWLGMSEARHLHGRRDQAQPVAGRQGLRDFWSNLFLAYASPLLAQCFQTVQGYSPFGSGLRILPWTLAPMFIAPVAGALSDRISRKRIIGTGLTLQAIALAWIATVSTPDVPYSALVAPFTVAGVGMALFLAPVANVVLSAVRSSEEGKASGANNAIRELGGVFGVAVLAAVFSHTGGYETAESFSHGMNTAVAVGAAVVGLGAVAAVALPSRRRGMRAEIQPAQPLAEAAWPRPGGPDTTREAVPREWAPPPSRPGTGAPARPDPGRTTTTARPTTVRRGRA